MHTYYVTVKSRGHHISLLSRQKNLRLCKILPRMWNDHIASRLSITASVAAFVFLLSLTAVSAVGTLPDEATARRQSPIQEADAELTRAVRLRELLEFSVPEQFNGDAGINFYVSRCHAEIIVDRIRVEGDKIIVASEDEPGNPIRIELNFTAFWTVVFLLSTDDDSFKQLHVPKSFSLECAINTLNAAISFLVDPFSDTREMKFFRLNLVTFLATADISTFWSVKTPEDIPGLTGAALRQILDLYTGINYRISSLPRCKYSVEEQDESLIVYQAPALIDQNAIAVLLHLIRMCRITELNLRRCLIGEPLTRDMQYILACCGITRLVPPIGIRSCDNLFLTASSDQEAQKMVWHRLTEVSWFSLRRDGIHPGEFIEMLGAPVLRLCNSLSRPAMKPEDFSVLETLDIRDCFLPELPDYLKNATKLRTFGLIGHSEYFSLDFLKSMHGLEALYLVSTNLTEVPTDFLACFPRLTTLNLSINPLKELPEGIGQLEELRVLDVGNTPLSCLPDALCYCSNLTYLNLTLNRLASLPDRFSELRHLKYLNISGNRNKELMSVVAKCTSLEVLIASDNSISTLPSEFCNLTKLRVLELANNELSIFPPEICELPILRELDISRNCLFTLPPNITSLKYLYSFRLVDNFFEVLPDFVCRMLENNRFLQLYLSGNPFQFSDDVSIRGYHQLGLYRLRTLFGHLILPEEEYQCIRIQHEKDTFYKIQSNRPIHWNMKVLRQLRLTVPPHSKASKDQLRDMWTKILAEFVFTEDDRPIDGERLYELIEVLYDQTLLELRTHEISPANKTVMKDYIEAVTLCLQQKVASKEMTPALAILIQLGSSLENCTSGQMGALMELYRLHCVGQDPDDFEVFVKEFIATEKEDKFIKAVADPDHPQNIHLVLFWKNHMKDELGLNSEYADPYGRQGPDKFGNDPVAVLEAFIANFDVRAVIGGLTAKINSSGQVGPAWLYLMGADGVCAEGGSRFFVVEKKRASPSYGFAYTIKEAGAEEILIRMAILGRAPTTRLRRPSKRH